MGFVSRDGFALIGSAEEWEDRKSLLQKDDPCTEHINEDIPEEFPCFALSVVHDVVDDGSCWVHYFLYLNEIKPNFFANGK